MLKIGIILNLLSSFYSTSQNLTSDNNRNVSNVINFDLKSCGSDTDLAQNLNLSVDPKLPQIDYTLFLDAELSETIESGTSKYDITYNGLPFSPTINDLCTEIKKSNITCPLIMGHISSESKGLIPSDLSGKVIIKNQWYNNIGDRILCMLFTIKL